MNYYRSHIEEIFYLNGVAPLPPVEGTCYMFYPEVDRLVIVYHLRNTSDVRVPMRLRWFSVPVSAASSKVETGRFVVECRQKVHAGYRVFAVIAAEEKGIKFQCQGGKILSSRIERDIPPHGEVAVSFTVDIDINRPPEKRRRLTGKAVGQALVRAVSETEAAYARLPALPVEFRRFEPLVLKAVGALRTLRYMDRDHTGRNVPTCHAGKCGLAATWFWDSGFSLLGLGLAGDAGTAYGMIRILTDGIQADGMPPVHYAARKYQYLYQQPILAWGTAHLAQLCPNTVPLRRIYPALTRYVRHWLRDCDKNHNGLAEYPPGGTCWDDSLRWQDRFPIAFRPGERWPRKSWGRMRSELFESVDTNTHLYLECRALGWMAAQLGRRAEARAWTDAAAVLKRLIQRHLFNPAAGVYQDRCITDGRFTEMVTPACFMPIYAGITPPALARRLCRKYLLNPERFYTTFPFPSLDRSHPAFRSGGFLCATPNFPGSLTQQAYWIGRSWPHVCYWMVGALYRSGLRREADQAAVDVLDAINRSEAIYECYDSLTGFGNGHPECMWSCAAVIALAGQYYKQEPIP